MIKTIFIDVDDTIFDFGAGQKTALFETFNKLNYYIDESIYSLYDSINISYWKKFERGEITMEKTILTEYHITEFSEENEKVFGIMGKNTITGDTFEIKRISPNLKAVSSLIEKLNKDEVSLLHFYDIVRDVVYEASVLAIE